MEGLEPPRLTAPDPKSGAATNYATCARDFCKACKSRRFKRDGEKHIQFL